VRHTQTAQSTVEKLSDKHCITKIVLSKMRRLTTSTLAGVTISLFDKIHCRGLEIIGSKNIPPIAIPVEIDLTSKASKTKSCLYLSFFL
jgi:hypothetical protein